MFTGIRRAALVTAVTLAASACDSATAPHVISPAQLARHLDSLSAAAESTADGGNRSFFLGLAELAPANGASPVPLRMTTPFGTATWQGFVIKYVATAAAHYGLDSMYNLFAYNDYAVTDLLLVSKAFFDGNRRPPLTQAWLLVADSTVEGGSGDFSVQTVATRGACTLVSGLSHYISLGYEGCALAVFEATVSWTFDGATIAIARQPLNGVVLR